MISSLLLFSVLFFFFFFYPLNFISPFILLYYFALSLFSLFRSLSHFFHLTSLFIQAGTGHFRQNAFVPSRGILYVHMMAVRGTVLQSLSTETRRLSLYQIPLQLVSGTVLPVSVRRRWPELPVDGIVERAVTNNSTRYEKGEHFCRLLSKQCAEQDIIQSILERAAIYVLRGMDLCDSYERHCELFVCIVAPSTGPCEKVPSSVSILDTATFWFFD